MSVALRRLSSRAIYENPWMRLREDEVEREDGGRGVYAVVDKAPAAVVVPWDGKRVHLVGQHRYIIDRFCWELPQGAVERDPLPPPEEVARIELAEETGLRAGRLEHLGRLYFAYGLSSQPFDAFLATELEAGDPSPEPEEGDLHRRAVTPPQLDGLIRTGEMVDAASVAVWALPRVRGLAL